MIAIELGSGVSLEESFDGVVVVEKLLQTGSEWRSCTTEAHLKVEGR